MNSGLDKRRLVLNKHLPAFVCLFIVIVIFWGWLVVRDYRSSGDAFQVPWMHEQRFFERELFFRGIANAGSSDTHSSSPIIGAVIPHHYVGSRMIANLFYRLSDQKPETIVLIGPNHDDVGDHPVMTSKFAWSTDFGVVEPASGLIARLVADQVAFVDEQAVANEHSTTGLMPFVKWYLPNSTVVPITVKYRVPPELLERLVDSLQSFDSDSSVVIVASVDFSHYLTTDEAYKKDSETEQYLRQFDFESLLRLTSDHMDSPATIVTLFRTMQRHGIMTFDILDHANSGELLADTLGQTTSYFEITFHR